jgi:hypothetical protein
MARIGQPPTIVAINPTQARSPGPWSSKLRDLGRSHHRIATLPATNISHSVSNAARRNGIPIGATAGIGRAMNSARQKAQMRGTALDGSKRWRDHAANDALLGKHGERAGLWRGRRWPSAPRVDRRRNAMPAMDRHSTRRSIRSLLRPFASAPSSSAAHRAPVMSGADQRLVKAPIPAIASLEAGTAPCANCNRR